MTVYQYVTMGGGMTAAAMVEGNPTPAVLVREIKERLGLSSRSCKGQAAIDRDAAAVIDVPANVRLARDGRKQMCRL